MAILFYLVTKNKLEIPGLGFDYVPEITHGYVESVIGGTDALTCTAFHADYKKEFMKAHRTKWNLTRTHHRCLAVGYTRYVRFFVIVVMSADVWNRRDPTASL